MPKLAKVVLLIATLLIQASICGPSALADIISDFKQQNGTAEDFGLRRAVYLGRMFNGVTGGPYRRMDSMYAAITIAQSNNVELYAGDGNSNFDTALAQGKMTDTGIRVTNKTQNSTEVIYVPGNPSTTPPFKIATPAGIAINDTLAAKNYLDFWVVGVTGSGFTVPSTVAGSNANFFMRFDRSTAVPEPTSLVLAGIGLAAVAYRYRKKVRSAS